MRKALRFLCFALVLTGIGLGGFKLFSNWYSDNEYRQTQQALQKDLQQPAVQRASNAAPKKLPQEKPAPPSEGEALAVLRIPRFGSGYAPVIVEGVSDKALAKGPGHYPGTAMPGEIGNFAVAGHRTGWGSPFKRLPELKPGDSIIVEWQGRNYSYHVTQTKVVNPSDVGVIEPVPNKPGVEPDKARITLTTCTDRDPPVTGPYVHRLIVWGELDKR